MLEKILPALLEGGSEGAMFGQMHITCTSTRMEHTLSVVCLDRMPTANDVGIVTRALRALDFDQVVERWNTKGVELVVSRWRQPGLF